MNYLNILTNVLLGTKFNVTSAIGYIDTGNTLRCNMTGRNVIVATYEVATALASPQIRELIDAYIENPHSIITDKRAMPKGTHLIPYNTICSNNGLMLAMDIDYMFVDTIYIEKNPLIGISPNSFTILHTNKCVLLNKKYMKRGKRHVKHNKG